MALHHAPDGHHRLAAAVVLHAPRLDDRVERLLLRGVDEAAGVDDDHLGVGEIVGVLRAAIGELGEISLAVDGVLVAAEGDEADFHAGPTERAGGASGGRRTRNEKRGVVNRKIVYSSTSLKLRVLPVTLLLARYSRRVRPSIVWLAPLILAACTEDEGRKHRYLNKPPAPAARPVSPLSAPAPEPAIGSLPSARIMSVRDAATGAPHRSSYVRAP